MKRFKMILTAMVAVFAMAAVGAGAAQASNTGSITIDPGTGPASCDFTLTHGSWGSTGNPNEYSTSLTGIASVAGNCDVDNLELSSSCPDANAIIKNADGSARLTGCFHVETHITIFGVDIPIDCNYRANTISGSWTWADPPTNSVKRFAMTGSGTKIAPSDSACPSPVSVTSLSADVSYP